MGVKGLTSYIYSKEHLYFDEIELKNCSIIIDANSLVAHLYNANLAHTSAFGGDYDKLANEIELFFKRLEFNDVFPIVVFDGAAEKRKVSTIKSRCSRKVISLNNVTPFNYNCNCFPLFLRWAMKGKLIEMGITVLQTDFEADSEIAALAKSLKIPVLSNDSDFFIFDVLYVPIPMLDLNGGTRSPLTCKIFRMDKFLGHMDLDRSRLPLLAVILGNDYMKRSQLSPFLGQIKLGKSRRATYTQKVIVGVLRWLKSETVDSALAKILSCMRTRKREVLKQRIVKIMKSYTQLATVLHDYLPDTEKIRPFDETVFNSYEVLDSTHLCSEDEDSDSEEEVMDKEEEVIKSGSDGSCYTSEDDDVETAAVDVVPTRVLTGESNNDLPSKLPKWFIDKFRRGFIPPDALTLLNLKTFFANPQPECYSMHFAAKPYTPLLQCIAGILLSELVPIQYWHRIYGNKYRYEMITAVPYKNEVWPDGLSLEKIGILSDDERLKIFHDIVGVEINFLQAPDEWKLYLITVAYWLKNTEGGELRQYHKHAVIMMMIAFLVVDETIGYFRLRKTFIKKYGTLVSKLSKDRDKWKSPANRNLVESLEQALFSVDKNDCILIFDAFLPYYHVNRQTHCSKNFSNAAVHTYARLQNCFELVTLLNASLRFPYMPMKIHKLYDGTFLYNMTKLLKSRSNLSSYAEHFFQKAPSLLDVYGRIEIILCNFAPAPLVVRRSRKTKKEKSKVDLGDDRVYEGKDDNGSDSEPFLDSNNRYCLVSRW